MVKITNENGDVIATGRNLRVIHDRARRLFRRSLYTKSTKIRADERKLTAQFPDGTRSVVEFADASVLRGYVADRIKYGRGKFIALEG